MQNYLEMMYDVYTHGSDKGDRTGTGTRSKFAHQLRFDLTEGFPLLTTKKMHLKSIIHELLWFIKGDTNIKYLTDNNVTIWNKWADENGDLGPVYGAQWRAWRDTKIVPMDECATKYKDYEIIGDAIMTADGSKKLVIERKIDQLARAIDDIKNNPDSRRIIVNAWNVSDVDDMALPPCHCMFQFYVADNKLSLHFLQRSNDVFLGNPFNFASYALLCMMVAQVCGLEYGELVWSGVDVHLYNNHFEQAEMQMERVPFKLPTMHINPQVKNIDDFKFEDFELIDYSSHESISAPIAV